MTLLVLHVINLIRMSASDLTRIGIVLPPPAGLSVVLYAFGVIVIQTFS